jgi:hypothetical protein
MKRLISLAVLAIMSLSAFSAESDAVLDFRNIFWGVSKDSCYRDGKKVKFEKDRSTLINNAFFITGDPTNIGAVNLDKVLYIFNDGGKFYKVFLQGSVDQAEQMKFILTYKFGEFKNQSYVDDSRIMQWLVKDVTFTLKVVEKSRFELTIESSWQASEDYKKNTSVDDF